MDVEGLRKGNENLGVKVLSLFDGMACGMLAMQRAEVEVDEYIAYEVDKYAIQTSSHNFPMIQHNGDVFKADYTRHGNVDYLIGGSPCTFWSIAQKNNRETEASGLGWELFSQYVRALNEAKPKYFIYENNKSMSNAIRESISNTFGFEPICINSALVSAQNRQRLYWVGRRNNDGTYSKVDIDQPHDKGVLLRDVLDYVCDDIAAGIRPINTTSDNKAQCLRATCYKDGIRNIAGNSVDKRTGVAEPVCVAMRGRYASDGSIEQHYEAREDGKTNVLTRVEKDNRVAEPVNVTAVSEPVRVGSLPRPSGELSQSQALRVYGIDGKSVNITANGGGAGGKTGLYAIPIDSSTATSEPIRVGGWPNPRGELSNSQGMRVYSVYGKSINITANSGGVGSNTGLYAIPSEVHDGIPVKAISQSDGNTYTVYEVESGQITIKGKKYPIKLVDGYYIIRKLTVTECMRLQTVPEWYEFPVSKTQAYKMLGNGWTVDVIAHLIEATKF